MSGSETDRRTMLALLAAGVLSSRLNAAHVHLRALRSKRTGGPLLLFTPEEHELAATVAEMILPADDHSLGAREAGVARYIDLVLANSGESVKASWKEERTGFEEFARLRAGVRFLDAPPMTRAEILDSLAPRSNDPATAAQRFFSRMRSMTIYGYYSSEIGLLKELEYKGNQALAEFPGCQGG